MALLKQKDSIGRNNITHKKNLHYFDYIDTEEKAYFLGLLYADGTNSRKSFSITLQERDVSILEKMSVAIYGKVHLYRKEISSREYKGVIINGKPQYTLAVSSVFMCSRLAQIGMTQKKSLTHGFPAILPKTLIRHFVRGYFDGDGCLSTRINKQNSKVWAFMIASSKNFCDVLTLIIKEELGLKLRSIKMKSKISGICIGGNRQIKTITDWLYKDAQISLDRKRQKYEELCIDIARSDAKLKASKYKNITFCKRTRAWIARTRLYKQTIHVGRFDTEEAAYKAQQDYLVAISTQQNASNQDGLCVGFSLKQESVSEPSVVEAT